MITGRVSPLCSSTEMSASGSPSTTIRSARAPALTTPSWPLAPMISAFIEVACVSSSNGEKTGLRGANSVHWNRSALPSGSAPKPIFTPASFMC
jgi:hypothetical protein